MIATGLLLMLMCEELLKVSGGVLIMRIISATKKNRDVREEGSSRYVDAARYTTGIKIELFLQKN